MRLFSSAHSPALSPFEALVSCDPLGRYRTVKGVCCDPMNSAIRACIRAAKGRFKDPNEMMRKIKNRVFDYCFNVNSLVSYHFIF